MSLDEILDRMHCCGQMGTLDMEDDEDRKTAKEAILSDLLEIIGEDELVMVAPNEFERSMTNRPELLDTHAQTRNNVRQELRKKVKKYCD